MKVKDIVEKIKKIDHTQIADFATNFYGRREENEDVVYFEHIGKTYIFSVMNDDVEKVFFWGSRLIISEILNAYNSSHVVECIARDVNEFEWFSELHYLRFMTLQRCHVSKMDNCVERMDCSISNALQSEASVLMQLIYDHFDSVTSRYMMQNELEDLIKQRTVWKWEENKKIAAFLIAKTEGKKLCIEYLYNGSCNFKASYLIQKIKNYAREHQLICVYAWKDLNNIISRKMYNNNGFVEEKMYKVIYIKEV